MSVAESLRRDQITYGMRGVSRRVSPQMPRTRRLTGGRTSSTNRPVDGEPRRSKGFGAVAGPNGPKERRRARRIPPSGRAEVEPDDRMAGPSHVGAENQSKRRISPSSGNGRDRRCRRRRIALDSLRPESRLLKFLDRIFEMTRHGESLPCCYVVSRKNFRALHRRRDASGTSAGRRQNVAGIAIVVGRRREIATVPRIATRAVRRGPRRFAAPAWPVQPLRDVRRRSMRVRSTIRSGMVTSKVAPAPSSTSSMAPP